MRAESAKLGALGGLLAIRFTAQMLRKSAASMGTLQNQQEFIFRALDGLKRAADLVEQAFHKSAETTLGKSLRVP